MADYTHWTEQVYALDAPTNWAEVTKIMAVCKQVGAASYDDSVIVDVVDTTGEGNYQIQFRFKVGSK